MEILKRQKQLYQQRLMVKFLFLNIEEGAVLEENLLVGIVDTINYHLNGIN